MGVERNILKGGPIVDISTSGQKIMFPEGGGNSSGIPIYQLGN